MNAAARSVVAVVQARTGSSRLPGKVLRPLPAPSGSLTVLDWVVRRVSRGRTVDRVVVATSTAIEDDRLVDHCNAHGYVTQRGELHDVLRRVLAAAEAHGADTVVRITADCPLIDPGLVDELVTAHLAHGNDFTANRLPPPYPRTYPVGLDVEVAATDALRRADRESFLPWHREHVMPYLYEHPEIFQVEVIDDVVDRSDVRWTIDTVEDLTAVSALVNTAEALPDTDWRTLLAVWDAHPELAAINRTVRQKRVDEIDERSSGAGT
jgi:spore coat polysaccharide biosynthesis protein SpsF